MKQPVILFNGPPKSGKDFGVKLMTHALRENCHHFKLAQPLREIISIITVGPDDKLDAIKDANMVLANRAYHFTVRDVMIHVGERGFKDLFGRDIWGQILLQKMAESGALKDYKPILISDLGFPEELTPIIDRFDPKNCAIFHIHRPGYDFSKDSRDWVYHPDISTYDIHNRSTLVAYRNELMEAGNHFFDSIGLLNTPIPEMDIFGNVYDPDSEEIRNGPD